MPRGAAFGDSSQVATIEARLTEICITQVGGLQVEIVRSSSRRDAIVELLGAGFRIHLSIEPT